MAGTPPNSRALPNWWTVDDPTETAVFDGALGIGGSSYDPASYGGFLTAFVLSRAGDHFYDADDGPPFTPGAAESVSAFLPDVVVTPTADGASNFTNHFAIGGSLRYRGTKTAYTTYGAYFENKFFGTKTTGAEQVAFMYGMEAITYTNDSAATGDIGDLAAGYFSAAHYGSGVVANLIGLDVLAFDGTPASGAVTNAYGIRLDNIGQTAGVTTSYGIYLAAQTGAGTAWSIYSAGGDVALAGAFVQLVERTDAAAPAANGVRVYARDTGGKTELVARFASGAVQQIAIEP